MLSGLIRQNRGSITMTDCAGLEEMACECYGRVMDLYQRLLRPSPGVPQERSL